MIATMSDGCICVSTNFSALTCARYKSGGGMAEESK
jgi:hypothetical protein